MNLILQIFVIFLPVVHDFNSNIFQAYLHALAFPEMLDRKHQVNTVHPGTGQWIKDHIVYKNWIANKRGLLWIEGKPGAGKSTLMGFIHETLGQNPTLKDDIMISFFFHGRGTMLQKNPVGLFRSLLHQLYIKVPGVRKEIQDVLKQNSYTGTSQWHLKELEHLFSNSIVTAAKSKCIVILIDALDEAGTNVANELAKYFHRLNDKLDEKRGIVRICISCRHYPIVSRIEGLKICVEDRNYNDIRSYVHDELSSQISELDVWPELESDITKKASGSFLWVRLVVPNVIRYALDGESLKSIRYLLAKMPRELGDFYRNILENVVEARNRHRTLLLMQWICLAERPLSIKELRYAMGSDVTCLHLPQRFCEDSEDFVEDGQRMTRQIIALSGGLAKVFRGGYGTDKFDERYTTVQFIHQSVNDFLRDRGLDSLFLALQNLNHRDAGPRWTPAAGNIIGQSQDRLSKACLNYLRLDELVDDSTWTEIGMTGDAVISDWGKESNRNPKIDLERKFPFLEYAATCWFLHAEMAERLQIPQDDIIQSFPDDSHPAFQTWRFVFNIFRKHTWQYHSPGAGLLHIASRYNLQTTVRALLRKGKNIEAADESGLTALHYAARWGHTGLAAILLDAHADIEAASDGLTPLVRAAARGHEDMVGLLLQRGANVNQSNGNFGDALYSAIRSGKRKVVEILLHGGADMNVRGGTYGNNALQLAVKLAVTVVDDTIVQLLLDKGADVNAQGGIFGNALQTASYLGRHSIVQLLLDRGADINVQGGMYGNALQAASFNGKDEIVHLLLKMGANVNAQGGEYGNALQAASRGGQLLTVQLLLNKGADINIQNGEYRNALQVAARKENDIAVQYSLDKGAKIRARGTMNGNTLQAACFLGLDNVLQLLWNFSADINADRARHDLKQLRTQHNAQMKSQRIHHGTALQAACFQWEDKVVQLLLKYGTDINTQGGEYGNALQAACFLWENKVVQLLLNHGSDINAQGGKYGNALQAACSKEHSKGFVAPYSKGYRLVRLLLQHGAHVNTQGGRYGNALQAASSGGLYAVVWLLLRKGAYVNAQGGEYGNALQAASSKGHDDIVQLLLKNSAHPLTNNCERPEDTGSAECKLKMVEELSSSQDEE